MRSIVAALIAALSASAFATGTHDGTPAQNSRATRWNRTHDLRMKPMASGGVYRPFSETEPTAYVMVSGEDAFDLSNLRDAMAKNLPASATMVVYVTDSSLIPSLKKAYSNDLGNRLKFLVVPDGDDTVWGRDSMPFPVYLTPATFGLVDSLYYQNFEPDKVVADAFNWPMTSTGIYFRGGNLLFDYNANCFAEVAREVAAMKDPTGFFTQYFGCKTVTLLKQQGGIGDIDERIKFMGDKNVLTDNDAYAQQLTNMGYIVHKMPTTGDNYETYMNTLYVNGTIFVPQMGIAADQAAISAYAALGMKAVGVSTKLLADQGHGNIHCVTMNYPAGMFTPSLRGADFVEFAGR